MTSVKSAPLEHVEQKSAQQKEPQSKQESQRQKREKKKAKKAAKEPLDDPTKIVQAVLDKSSFKVPNLSQIVEEKFYNAPDYNLTLCKLLKKVSYESTVGTTSDNSTCIETSVLPFGFEGRVDFPVMAITELPCINEEVKKRKWKKGPKPGKKNNASKNNKNKSSVGPENKSKTNNGQVNNNNKGGNPRVEANKVPTSKKSEVAKHQEKEQQT